MQSCGPPISAVVKKNIKWVEREEKGQFERSVRNQKQLNKRIDMTKGQDPIATGIKNPWIIKKLKIYLLLKMGNS